MRKMKLEVTETLTYKREIEVVIPDDMSDPEFERHLDKAEKNSEDASDVARSLGYALGVSSVTKEPDTDYDSPASVEIEIDSYDEVDYVGG